MKTWDRKLIRLIDQHTSQPLLICAARGATSECDRAAEKYVEARTAGGLGCRMQRTGRQWV